MQPGFNSDDAAAPKLWLQWLGIVTSRPFFVHVFPSLDKCSGVLFECTKTWRETYAQMEEREISSGRGKTVGEAPQVLKADPQILLVDVRDTALLIC